ncbi:hypothetical protein DK59_3083 [Brucella abortus bv. 4 str. 292]|nr:hypothetical protein DK59_3083 [Brucella abortus bv. 4 str. 292]
MRGNHARNDIRHGNADARRLSIDLPRNRHQAGFRLHDEIITRSLRLRAGLAITGNRAIDDAGIERFQAFIIDLQPFDRP